MESATCTLRACCRYEGCAWQADHFGEGACDSNACACDQAELEADSPFDEAGFDEEGEEEEEDAYAYPDHTARAYGAYTSRKDPCHTQCPP